MRLAFALCTKDEDFREEFSFYHPLALTGLRRAKASSERPVGLSRAVYVDGPPEMLGQKYQMHVFLMYVDRILCYVQLEIKN